MWVLTDGDAVVLFDALTACVETSDGRRRRRARATPSPPGGEPCGSQTPGRARSRSDRDLGAPEDRRKHSARVPAAGHGLVANATGLWVVDRPRAGGDRIVRIDPQARGGPPGQATVGRNPTAIRLRRGQPLGRQRRRRHRLAHRPEAPVGSSPSFSSRSEPDSHRIAAGEGGVWVTVHPDQIRHAARNQPEASDHVNLVIVC